jgi:diaminopimelate epimerase
MNKIKIPFMKMTGSGNDFILIDNRQMLIPPEKAAELARKACRPKLSLGEGHSKISFNGFQNRSRLDKG